MKLLSGFLLIAMILLVFKRNNWRENGHLVVSAFAVNEIFWSLYFCENIVTCQLVKAGKNLPWEQNLHRGRRIVFDFIPDNVCCI